MRQIVRSLMVAIALQSSLYALETEVDFFEKTREATEINDDFSENFNSTEASFFKKGESCHKKSRRGPTGPAGAAGPQGAPGQPFGEYAAFFMTTSSGGVDLIPGQNFIFNNQVALSGIAYDSSTGVFTFGPGTYSVVYLYDPNILLNMYVNDQLILNSPIAGSSTIFTVEEVTNTLTLQVMATQSFSAPTAGNSIASIALFRID